MNPGEFLRVYSKNQSEIDSFCKEHESIYRFLPFERFLETMYKSHLVFTAPRLWKDPFDNFLFRQEISNKNSVVNKLYVCCFTLNPHSQAYWQSYSDNGYCVRLRIRTKEFFKLMMSHSGNISLGRMRYLKETDLTHELSSTPGIRESLERDGLSHMFLQAFHLKRLPFKYEDEIRVTIQGSPSLDGLKRLTIELNEIVEDIYLDPRMGKFETLAIKEYLTRYSIKVKKSQLFKDKKIVIQ